MRPGNLSQALTDSSCYGTLCVSISPSWLLSPIKCSFSKSAKGIIKTARVDFSWHGITPLDPWCLVRNPPGSRPILHGGAQENCGSPLPLLPAVL